MRLKGSADRRAFSVYGLDAEQPAGVFALHQKVRKHGNWPGDAAFA